VPVEQMMKAERAVRDAATGISGDLKARFESDKSLNEEDRKTIIAIARQALEPFVPKATPDLGTRSHLDGKAERKPDQPSAKAEIAPKSKALGDKS
jgi:F-type H+-transporting ATPase subunit alpha